MFEINDRYQQLESDFYIISDNYKIFHFDEFPILFSGTNIFGNWIIGSLMEEDEGGYLFRYIYSVVTPKTYNDFVKQKISYRELLLSQKLVNIVDKDINDIVKKIYNVGIDLIPVEYLPLQKSYCPNVQKVLGLEYSFSLQGKLADSHAALLNTVTTVTGHIGNIFENLIKSISIRNVNPKLQLIPVTEGSFRINFKIIYNRSGQLSLFTKDNEGEAFSSYVQNFLDYAINDFVNETEFILEKCQPDIIGLEIAETIHTFSRFDEKIGSSLKTLLDTSYQNVTEEDEKRVIKAILRSANDLNKIGNEIGKGFDRIEVLGMSREDDKVSIGLIDNEFASVMSDQVEIIESFGKTIEIDTEYQTYDVQIYNLNTDTRKGAAHIINKLDSKTMDRPKILIEGEGDLTESIFTESLHLNRFMSVNAKAKTINGKYVSLNIQFTN